MRPVNKREKELDAKCVVKISGSQIILNKSHGSKKQNIFTFDSCFDSMDSQTEGYANQETIFDSIGSKILENAFKGLSILRKSIFRVQLKKTKHLRLQRMHFCLRTDRIRKIVYDDGI